MVQNNLITFFESVTDDKSNGRVDLTYCFEDGNNTLEGFTFRLYGKCGEEIARGAMCKDAGDDFQTVWNCVQSLARAYQNLIVVYHTKTQGNDKLHAAIAEYAVQYGILRIQLEAQTKDALTRDIANAFSQWNAELVECAVKFASRRN